MNTIQRYFELEKRRTYYAKKRKPQLFLKTYEDNINLKNSNTMSFWNNRIIKEYGSLPESPIYRNKIKLVTDFVRDINGKVLDIGFGYGHVEKELLKLSGSIQVYGVDFSISAVKRIKKEIKGNFIAGNILNLPYKSSFFDCILVLDVLEHLPPNKVFKAYKEVYRSLKKGGYLVVSIPVNEGLEQKLGKGINPGAHLREYTPDIIKYELNLSKFKVLNEVYLYAFEKGYFLKNLLVRLSPFRLREPNQMIIFAQKI